MTANKSRSRNALKKLLGNYDTEPTINSVEKSIEIESAKFSTQYFLNKSAKPDFFSPSNESVSSFLYIAGGYMPWPKTWFQKMLELTNASLKDEDPSFEPVTTAEDIDWDLCESYLVQKSKRNKTAFVKVLKCGLESLKDLANKENMVWKNNLNMLGELLHLSDNEIELMKSAYCKENFELFEGFCANLRARTVTSAIEEMSYILGLDKSVVIDLINAKNKIYKNGLLVWPNVSHDIDEFLNMPSYLSQALSTPQKNIESLVMSFLEINKKPSLGSKDFPHLTKEISLIKGILAAASSGESPRAGLNVLVYGEPGVGKSQLASALVEELGVKSFSVKNANKQGTASTPKDRFMSFMVSQSFLETSNNSVIIFDEVEGVLPNPNNAFEVAMSTGGDKSSNIVGKAWLNALLEENPVPTIWICNEIDGVDPAYLRRFAFHLEMRVPPKNVRKKIIQSAVKDLDLKEITIEHVADHQDLTPAQIEMASKVVRMLGPGTVNRDELFLTILRNSMGALGQSKHVEAPRPVTKFDINAVNTSGPIKPAQILKAVKASKKLSLCLYGLPGTGKTQLAQFMAEELGKPLLVKRVSDLSSKYVGDTEKNIARMFIQAEAEDAVLLLDEADSFMRKREDARNGWEVTQTNELIQQMECFEGVFICATNLYDQLDEAVLRRFTFKLRFEALKVEQRIALFNSVCGFSTENEDNIKSTLASLNNLTPGDFATVRRQEILLDNKFSDLEFVAQLKIESEAKSKNISKPIGFY